MRKDAEHITTAQDFGVWPLLIFYEIYERYSFAPDDI